MSKTFSLVSASLIFLTVSFAKGDGAETNRISRLQYELQAAGLPFDPETVIRSYRQEFELSDPEILKDLERAIYDSTLTMHQRANAYSCYLHLDNEKQAKNDAVLRDLKRSPIETSPSETRIQSLRRSLGTYTPVETWAFLASYYREFNADENCLRNDLAAIAQNPSVEILSRQQAFCAYADLAGDDALDFVSTIQPDDILRKTCMSVAIRHSSDTGRALDRSQKWMLEKKNSEQGFNELQSIACAWMDVYHHESISPEHKSSIVKMFREILNQATDPLPIVCADAFLTNRNPEYVASGLRAETIKKWFSRTNDAPLIFQERCSRFFRQAAKECGLSLNPALDPTEFTKDETKQSETDGSGYGIPPGSRESVNPTGSATPEKIDGSCNPSPWCFAGLILPLGLAAWWIFRRK